MITERMIKELNVPGSDGSTRCVRIEWLKNKLDTDLCVTEDGKPVELENLSLLSASRTVSPDETSARWLTAFIATHPTDLAFDYISEQLRSKS